MPIYRTLFPARKNYFEHERASSDVTSAALTFDEIGAKGQLSAHSTGADQI
jgi:hypothetical protein